MFWGLRMCAWAPKMGVLLWEGRSSMQNASLAELYLVPGASGDPQVPQRPSVTRILYPGQILSVWTKDFHDIVCANVMEIEAYGVHGA